MHVAQAHAVACLWFCGKYMHCMTWTTALSPMHVCRRNQLWSCRLGNLPTILMTSPELVSGQFGRWPAWLLQMLAWPLHLDTLHVTSD